MTTSLRQFRVDLYEEHLEEAAFLWEQCRAVRAQPDLAWTAAGGFEERLEAHLDALMVGGDLALDVCRRRATEGEAGELFAAVCVFCRYAQAPLLASVLRALDYGDPKRSEAVADALKRELPDTWQEPCLRGVGEGDGPIASLLSTVVGYRRLGSADLLVRALDRVSSAPQQRAVLWAIGRMRPAHAAHRVRPFLQSSDSFVRGAARRALLRLNDQDTLGDLVSRASEPESHLELALAAGGSAAAPLATAARLAEASADTVAALGLLGELSAVATLLELLIVPRVANAAADALYVMTGAPLFTEERIPDTMTEDEMFEAEREAFRETGHLPTRGDGQPYATLVRQLSTDPVAWSRWLKSNASRFTAERRYRLGRPCDPTVLMQCLSADSYPKVLRGLAADELLIRYGVDLPIETDMPVLRQLQILQDAAPSVTESAGGFDPGRWYFAGRAV